MGKGKLVTITETLQDIAGDVVAQGEESSNALSDIYDMLNHISQQLERIANAVER